VNVLFVCEDNSALSIMAESILKSVAPGRFGAFSAGCFPKASLNPDALDFLAKHHMPVAQLSPKRLEEFRESGASRMDFIITLCDVAASEPFSDWPGDPFIAHWNVQTEDRGDADEALRDSFWTLMRRIKIFASLPQGKLSRRLLQQRALTLEPSYL
jgi:arsenate reductase